MKPYLKIDHVEKTFIRGTSETKVLAEINLSIEKGEYVSIIGHSGCGKSTLLNIVAGLLPATTSRWGTNGWIAAVMGPSRRSVIAPG